MKLIVHYDFGNALGPGWVISLRVGEKAAAQIYNHEPTVKEVVDFVNECGELLDGTQAAA